MHYGSAVECQPGAHDAREKSLWTEAIYHRIHGEPIDQEVTERSPESCLPFHGIDGGSDLFLEQTAITLNPRGRIISRSLRSQCETEKLGKIALRRTDSCKLPIVCTNTQRNTAKHDIPGIEIVVNQSLETAV